MKDKPAGELIGDFWWMGNIQSEELSELAAPLDPKRCLNLGIEQWLEKLQDSTYLWS